MRQSEHDFNVRNRSSKVSSPLTAFDIRGGNGIPKLKDPFYFEVIHAENKENPCFATAGVKSCK